MKHSGFLARVFIAVITLVFASGFVVSVSDAGEGDSPNVYGAAVSKAAKPVRWPWVTPRLAGKTEKSDLVVFVAPSGAGLPSYNVYFKGGREGQTLHVLNPGNMLVGDSQSVPFDNEGQVVVTMVPVRETDNLFFMSGAVASAVGPTPFVVAWKPFALETVFVVGEDSLAEPK